MDLNKTQVQCLHSIPTREGNGKCKKQNKKKQNQKRSQEVNMVVSEYPKPRIYQQHVIFASQHPLLTAYLMYYCLFYVEVIIWCL